MMQGRRLAVALGLGLAGGAQRGEGHDVDAGAGVGCAADGAVGQQAQDRFEAVVAGVVQVIGLGGGEQQAVDARPEQ